jgi:hypothetical protein
MRSASERWPAAHRPERSLRSLLGRVSTDREGEGVGGGGGRQTDRQTCDRFDICLEIGEKIFVKDPKNGWVISSRNRQRGRVRERESHRERERVRGVMKMTCGDRKKGSAAKVSRSWFPQLQETQSRERQESRPANIPVTNSSKDSSSVDICQPMRQRRGEEEAEEAQRLLHEPNPRRNGRRRDRRLWGRGPRRGTWQGAGASRKSDGSVASQ